MSLVLDRREWTADGIYRGLYERAESRIVEALLPPGGTFVDVGANIGWYTMVGAAAVGPSGTVIVVEPSPRCLASLRAGLGNLPPGVVELHEVAAGSVAGSAVLLDPGDDDHGGLGTLRPGAQGSSTTVPVRPLDEIIGTRTVDVVKIDVEGFEPQVLEGAVGLLADPERLGGLLLEVSPEFGSVEYAAHLVDALDGSHEAHLVGEAGRFVRRPKLDRVGPSEVASLRTQRNLLLVRRDRVASLRSVCVPGRSADDR